MFAALLDTCVLWPSLQRDVLLSLAAEGLYRPPWSSVILDELEYEETRKLIDRGATPDEATERASHLIAQMRSAFDDSEVIGWEGLEGTYGLSDADDECVAAAAVVGGAGATVTHNDRRFLSDVSDQWPYRALAIPAASIARVVDHHRRRSRRRRGPCRLPRAVRVRRSSRYVLWNHEEVVVVELRPGYGLRLAATARLLLAHEPAARVEADWPAGRVRLSAYLGDAELPCEIPGRVRCIVTDPARVLVTWNPNGVPDCLPGGGAHPGETIVDTAAREVWEETGWHIDPDSVDVLGWIHLESLYEFNPALPFSHPDSFMTVVYARLLRGQNHPGGWQDTDGYVVRSEFLAVDEMPVQAKTDPISRLFLDAIFPAEEAQHRSSRGSYGS